MGLVVLAAVLATTALAPAQAAPKSVRVMQRNFEFMPDSVEVTVGTKVVWTYDERPTDLGCEFPAFQLVPGAGCPGHSVTSHALRKDGKHLFDSGVHRADGFPFSYTFTKPGTYRYYCIPHGNGASPLTSMDAVVIVKKKK